MNICEESYRRFIDGEESAFDDIIDAYNESLIFFIHRYVHNLDAAEDLAEDCFVELIVHPHRYNFKVSLKTYLFTVARNKSVDYIRHNSALQMFPLDEETDKSVAYEGFENKVLCDERHRAIHRALGSMKENLRTVIHLIYFEGLSNDEVGKIMGKSRKQVENLAYRARNELRAILTEEGWNDEGQN